MKFYLTFIAVIAGSIFVNYQYDWWGGTTMQYHFASPHYYKWSEPIVFGIFHGAPYLLAVVLLKLFKFKLNLSKGFWVSFIVAFGLIGIRRGTNLFQDLSPFFEAVQWKYWAKIFYNLYTLLLMFIPLIVLYKLYYKKQVGHFFGIQTKGVKFGPYWLMLLGMVPLILGASFSDSFLKMYPTYPVHYGGVFAAKNGVSESFSFWFYEFFYILDYASIELFFRGFLIFVMVKYLGKEVVFPMVLAYVWLHFGKPLGETIGSAFGGYILGITALYSRNIWGGIFIHMGVAFLMDVFAMWQLN